MTHAKHLANDPQSPLNVDAHAGQKPMNPNPQNKITLPLNSASISAVTLRK